MRKVFISCLLLCICSFSFSKPLKIVIFVPAVSDSVVRFNYRVGDILAEAGHEVTLFRPEMDDTATKTEVKHAKVWKIETGMEEDFKRFFSRATHDQFVKEAEILKFDDWNKFFRLLDRNCQAILDNEESMEMLKTQDLAIVWEPVLGYCPFGIVHAAGIPAKIWMSSMDLVQQMAWRIGVPSPPSYVPTNQAFLGDEMSYYERFQNLMANVVFEYIDRNMIGTPQTQIFRDHFGPDFPDLLDLAASSELVFVNSEELLDFPRPILHKTVYIGGFDNSNAPKLNEDWDRVLRASKDGAVYISFGSIVKGANMPPSWKEAIIGMARRFPSLTFIWKYEKDRLDGAEGLQNIVLTKWAPQKELLADKRVKCFISHAGYNSVIESTYAGTPLILVPILYDQFGNAMKVQRNGVGTIVKKADVSVENLSKALETVLSESSNISANAQKLSRMIRAKPVKARDLLVKWVEFVGEFQSLPHLQPSANRLTFLQYFLIDILLPLALLPLLVLVVSFYLIRRTCSKLCGADKKNKKD